MKRSYMLPRYLPRKTSLPGLQTLSECDSTIAFHGIGRRKWLSIVKSDEEYCNALGVLRESLQIEDCLFDMIESVLCQAYGFLNKPNVNDIQYEKCCGEKFPETSKIPATKDELHQHVKRINLQVVVWKNASEADEKIPEADQHDWGGIDRIDKVPWTIQLRLTRLGWLSVIARKENVMNNAMSMSNRCLQKSHNLFFISDGKLQQ